MTEAFPQVADVLPRFMGIVHDLNTAHVQGEWRSWAEAETAVRHAFTPTVMADIESHIPGWQTMAGYEDEQTLVHECSVFVAMLSHRYYRQGTAVEQRRWEWAVLLHDLAKVTQKGKRDLTHAFRSAAMAVRILPAVGFSVQAAYGQMVDEWVMLVETAVCSTPAGSTQDNHQLPAILDGIEHMFGAGSTAALILKTILLHHSFSPILDWPNPSTLTDAEAQAFISPALWRVLGPFLAFDSDGWDMYDVATRPLHAAQLDACIIQVQQLLSNDK